MALHCKLLSLVLIGFMASQGCFAEDMSQRKKEVLLKECLTFHEKSTYSSFVFTEAPPKYSSNTVTRLDRAQWVSSHWPSTELELKIYFKGVNRFGEPMVNSVSCDWSVPEYVLLNPKGIRPEK